MADPMKRDATISTCRRYRYFLSRQWNEAEPHVLFVMLNPSTADADVDDPTIRRCSGFAHTWGYGGIAVVNLFALRATDPAELAKATDPIGPENDRGIEEAASRTQLIVCAWGAHPLAKPRARDVLAILRRVGTLTTCLRATKDGSPSHPLYLPATLLPQPFAAGRE